MVPVDATSRTLVAGSGGEGGGRQARGVWGVWTLTTTITHLVQVVHLQRNICYCSPSSFIFKVDSCLPPLTSVKGAPPPVGTVQTLCLGGESFLC